MMNLGAGVIYGMGVFSGLVLAALAFLIYLALRTETPVDPDVEALTARTQALTAKVTAGKNKVQDASAKVAGIEPGE